VHPLKNAPVPASSAGRNVPPPTFRDFFVYATPSIAIAALAPASISIQVQADSDFELQKLTFFADIALAAQTESTRVLPLVSMQITDTGSGRAIFSQPLAIPSVCGDGRIPFILTTPKLFVANASIQIDFVNFSAATAYNLRVDLIGAKLFRY
jgi:hypothetical protein